MENLPVCFMKFSLGRFRSYMKTSNSVKCPFQAKRGPFDLCMGSFSADKLDNSSFWLKLRK